MGYGQFVGREEALRRLFACLASTDTASPRTVSITGTAGIGKSTLLRRFAAEAQAQGWSLGWGVASARDGSPPLSAWHEALADLQSHQTSGGFFADLEAQERVALFRSVSNWLSERVSTTPTLLVLEDLHDADQSTIELLGYIGRRPMSQNLLIVASSRTDLGPDAPRGNAIRLEGLSKPEAQQLADALDVSIDDYQLDEVLQRTGGNPFFLQRLLEQGIDGGLPIDVRSVLDEDLSKLTTEQRICSEILAVLGTSAPVQLVQNVSDRLYGATRLDPTSEVVVEDLADLRFAHALFREALYDSLSDDKRSKLHAAVAEVLRENDENPSVVAHHLARAAKHEFGHEAASFAAEAGRIASDIGALPEALEHFAFVVSLRRTLNDDEALAAALIAEAVALGRAGRAADAQQRLLEAADIPDLTQSTQVLLVREFGRLRWREEPNPSSLQSASLVRLATDWLSKSDDPRVLSIYETALVSAADIDGITSSSLKHAERAVALAAQSGDDLTIGEAHVARRRALMAHHGVLRQRSSDSAAAAKAAAKAGDGELLGRAQRLALCDAMASGDRSAVIRLIEIVEAVPSTAFLEHQALWRAELASLEGRFTDAAKILQEANDELTYLGVSAPALDYIQVVHAWHAGELSGPLAEYEPFLVQVGDIVLTTAVALGKVIDGNPEAASDLIELSIDELCGGEMTMLWPTAALVLAEVISALDHPAAERVLETIRPYSGQCSVSAAAGVPWIGSFDRHLGLLSARLGNNTQAIEYLDAGLALETRMGAKPWIARSHAALSMVHSREGNGELAQHHADLGVRLQEELGLADVLLLGDWSPQTNDVHAPPTRQRHRDASFVRDGAVWNVSLNDVGGTTKQSVGMEYLSLLLQSPDSDWHVLDLYQATTGGSVASGSSGSAIDDQARRAYQERYRDLSTQLAESEAFDDQGRIELIREEIEMLEQQLLGAFGLGGRSRQLNDPTERARVNVRRSISRALSQVSDVAPLLGDHLVHRIQTGRFCRYANDPSDPVVWTLS